MNEYLAIDSGEHLCTSSFRELIAAWLNTSRRSRDGVRLNRFAGEESVKRFEQSCGLDTALYKTLPLPF